MLTTENKLWLPPLSFKDQEKLDQVQKDHKKAKQTQILFGISAAFVGVIVLIYTWFRFNWPLWVLISLILIGTLLLILLIRAGYTAQWTGFSDKRGWDWLQLLIQVIGAIAIPLSIIVGLYTFTTQQKDDNLRTQQLIINSAKLADTQQQETTLQTYLNDMTTLLFDDKLGGKAPTSAEAAVIARSKTIIALNRLTDPQRKATVVDFLYESHLIGYNDSTNNSIQPPIVDLSGADLTYANLTYANLTYANLSNANLYEANLNGADLNYSNLSYANMSYVKLYEANLNGADLYDANLYGVDLYGADLSNADLYGADLYGADLSNADLYGADLSEAYLRRSNLSSAKNLTQQQLDQVLSCAGATLPQRLTCHRNT